MLSDREHLQDDPPPFLGTWRNVYTAVLVYMVLLIVIFYFFTRAFA
jgi:hypothetical protein